MSGNQSSHAGFSSGEEYNVVQHRSVSRLAIASMVLGLVSAAAIWHPVAWCVPIVAVTLAIAALRTMSTDGTTVIGRKAALAGLAMALVFGACGLTRHFARPYWLYHHARPHAEKWIDLVRSGRLHEAHQLHLPRGQRQSPDTDLVEFYEGDEFAGDEIDVFFDQPPLNEIIRIGLRGQLRFVGNVDIGISREGYSTVDLIDLRYAIDHENDGKPQTLTFLVSVARRYDAEYGEAQWNVQDVNSEESPDL